MTKRSAIHIFSAVIKALFLRELNMRMSVGKAGLFWTFFEPFAQVSVFILIRVAIHGTSGDTSNYSYAVFMASGFIAFNMFRHILKASSGAFTANRGLFSYKQVKPIDTIIARTLVEVFITGTIITVFLFVGFVLQMDIVPQNIIMVFGSYLWLVLFSFGIGLVVGIGNTFYVSIGRIVNISSFLLLIFSAVFYPVEALPPDVQTWLLYNPLVHFMELIHASYINSLTDRYVDYIYMLEWTIIPIFIGMWLYVRLEKKIISQ